MIRALFFSDFQDIKIYPEWNVNVFVVGSCCLVKRIKIYPEWNVNFTILYPSGGVPH